MERADGTGAAVVDVRELAFRYRGREGFALEVEALAVAGGEALAVTGPSGSGKSTLLALLSGLLVAERGRVVTDGVEWARVSEAARRRERITRVGLVFQELELLDHLTVEENVLLPYLVHPALRLDAAARERARGLAASAGIERHLSRRPRELSQGERQRVAILRALVTRPRVVLADEPTGNLDAATAAAVLDLFLEAVRESAAALVLVTHDRSLLGRFDRAVDLPGLASAGAPAEAGAAAAAAAEAGAAAAGDADAAGLGGPP